MTENVTYRDKDVSSQKCFLVTTSSCGPAPHPLSISTLPSCVLSETTSWAWFPSSCPVPMAVGPADSPFPAPAEGGSVTCMTIGSAGCASRLLAAMIGSVSATTSVSFGSCPTTCASIWDGASAGSPGLSLLSGESSISILCSARGPPSSWVAVSTKQVGATTTEASWQPAVGSLAPF